MNERFDLASWELAPDSPEKLAGVASGRVKAQWLGDEREFLLREVEIARGLWVVFLQRRDVSNDGSWVVCDNATWHDSTHSKQRVKRRINQLINNRFPLHNELHRVIHLPIVPAKTITIKPTGEVAFQSYIKNEVPTRFHLNGAAVEDQTASRHLEVLQRELMTPNSKGNFALQWEQMDLEKRVDVPHCFRKFPPLGFSLWPPLELGEVVSWGRRRGVVCGSDRGAKRRQLAG